METYICSECGYVFVFDLERELNEYDYLVCPQCQSFIEVNNDTNKSTILLRKEEIK
jgi:DNA-directed RNA polymerase subunit RPC12/RpoP